MLQRPGDAYAIWHFWRGSDREFAGWYVNFEAPFERTAIGFDTKDLELDIVIHPDRNWEFKDVDLLWQRHDEGRFTLFEVRRILELGEAIGAMVDSGRWWWGEAWTEWEPDPAWQVPELPPGWDRVAPAV
jgi:predicted RNA-binding protein associated with RNAse of E/G family